MDDIFDAAMEIAIEDAGRREKEERAKKTSKDKNQDDNKKSGPLSALIENRKREQQIRHTTTGAATITPAPSGWLGKKRGRDQGRIRGDSIVTAATAKESVTPPRSEAKKNEISEKSSKRTSFGSHVYTATGTDSPMSSVSMSQSQSQSQSQSPLHKSSVTFAKQRLQADSSNEVSNNGELVKQKPVVPAVERGENAVTSNNNNLQDLEKTHDVIRSGSCTACFPRFDFKPKTEESSDSGWSDSDEEDEAVSPSKKPPSKPIATKKCDGSDSNSDEEQRTPPNKQNAHSPQLSPPSEHQSDSKEHPDRPAKASAKDESMLSSEEKSPNHSPERKDRRQSSGKKKSLKRSRNSLSSNDAKSARKKPSNPLTIAQQEREENMRYAKLVRQPCPDDDLLWDGEDDDFRNPAMPTNASLRQNVDALPQEGQPEDAPMEVVEGGPREPNGANDGDDDDAENTSQSATEDDNDESVDGTDEEDVSARAILHPDFKNPIFGPFKCEPLCLPEQHEVPAALNRYLLDYQREGVQFLYDAIDSGRGGFLLDDMGLGKTVQVISTIAAFLGKTGTDLDRIRLKKRERIVANFKMELEKGKKKRLLEGYDVVTHDVEHQEIAKFKKERLGLAPLAPVLLIVPAVVVDNWDFEFTLWGHFSVARYREFSNRTEAIDQIKFGSAEVLLCPHSLFGKKEHFEDINRIQWQLVVVDEFHTFKTAKGDLSKNMRKLKKTSGCPVVGLTGTPMQNRHEELYNLVDIVSPNYLGKWRQFSTKYSEPIKLALAVNATKEAQQHGEKMQKELWTKLRPMYLQRMKTDVLTDMPEKRERVVWCELSTLQKKIYADLLDKPDYISLRGANAPCDCGINRNYFFQYKCLETTEEKIDFQRKNKYVKRSRCCYQTPVEARGKPVQEDAVLWKHQHPDGHACDRCPYCFFLPALTKLYQLSSHVSLLQVDLNDNKSNERDKQEAFAKVAFSSPEVLSKLPSGDIYRQDSCTDDHFEMSGKMFELHKLLKDIAKTEGRVLLFSYSTRTLDVIEKYLKMESHLFLRIDGSTPAKDRQSLVNTFQTDEQYFIMLLSTRAAGVGLNLTAADNVIIFDCEWNPALDSQAQDRSFRIGQKKDVTVYRLIAGGTIDELKYLRQIYKLALKNETFRSADESSSEAPLKSFKGVENDKSRKGELFGMENLLSFRRDGRFRDTVWKDPAKNAGSANKVDCDDAMELSKALHMGDTSKLDQQQEFIRKMTDKSVEKMRDDFEGRIQDHNDFLSKGRAVPQDDPDHIMGGETQQNDDFINRALKSSALDEDTIGNEASEVLSAKREQSNTAAASYMLPELHGSSKDKAPESVHSAVPTAKQEAGSSTSRKRVPKKTTPKNINFQICGVKADKIAKKKATFSKADFFLPKKR